MEKNFLEVESVEEANLVDLNTFSFVKRRVGK